MNNLTLEINTPDETIIKNKLDFVSFFTTKGSVGILPSHSPFMADLKNAPLKYFQNGTAGFIAVSGGFVKVVSDRIEIICDAAQETPGGN